VTVGDPFDELVPASWSDWVSGDWLRRRMPSGPSMPLFNESFGAMTRLFSGALAPAVAVSPVLSPPVMVERLLDVLRVRLIGRLISVVTARAEISLVLSDLRIGPSPLELALGHLGDVSASARDVAWGGRSIDTISLVFRNVHVRPGPEPTLIVAPVEVSATVGQASLDGWLRGTRQTVITLGNDTITVARRGQERWGCIEVEPHVGGSELRFVPTAISIRSRRFGVPRRTPVAFTVGLPPLPRGLVVTGAAVRDRQILLTGIIPEIREPMDPSQLQQLDRLARRGTDRFDVRELEGLMPHTTVDDRG
jgi:hypothetical protein